MEKLELIEELKKEVCDCNKCEVLSQTRKNTVFGNGDLDAKIMFIAEAPGKDEDESGNVLVGQAGQLFTNILAACGLKREEVYLCNVLKCRPPQNRNPQPKEIENCSNFLERQIALIDPKYIVCMGSFASNRLLGMNVSWARGEWHEYKGRKVLAIYHPSYLLRSPDKKQVVWQDLQLLLKEIKK